MRRPRDEYKVSIPEGISGDWRIEKFTVDAEAAKFDAMRAAISGSGRSVPEGTYTALFHKKKIIMSDTPDEIRDHLPPIWEAKAAGGRVLVNGLGIGMVTAAILGFENVERVTVIEISEDVIRLVAPTLQTRFGDRLKIVHEDAFKYKPAKGQRFSVVWHDIWSDICTDNLEQMATLHRRYGRRADWQDSWSKELLRYHRRRERGMGW